MGSGTRLASTPFEIHTLAHVSRMGGPVAHTARELQQGLENCSDESIYHHTIVAIRNHLILSDQLTNDFAEWSKKSLHKEELAGRLLTTAITDCRTLGELRMALGEAVRAYLEAHPAEADDRAQDPFYFCEGMEVTVPLEATARTLEELRRCVKEMNSESFYLHFVAPRTRQEMQSNDFSEWLEKSLGLGELAAKINEIDVMECTLDGAREKILELLDTERTEPLRATVAES